MSVQAKWKANQEKVAFLKQFPGLLTAWEQTVGHTVERVTPLQSKPGSVVLIFSDGSFAIAPPLTLEPRELTEGLSAARQAIESQHPQAFAEYDRLDRIDKEAARVARLENILGAIQNNLEDIPELKDRLRTLVKKWNQ